MAAVGQEKHWTVVDSKERATIRWEPVSTPQWRWIEDADRCPRTGTSWNDLTPALATLTPPSQLPSLEEYVHCWHATKHEHHRMFDVSTLTWLRTRGPSGSGALYAHGHAGRVGVLRWGAADLGIARSLSGSRASDPVER